MTEEKKYERMTPEMRAKAFKRFQQMVYGDLIKDKETAIALAELLIKSKFGDQVLTAQRPLNAKTDGDFWIVEGSVTKDSTQSLEGPVILRVNKADLTVEEFYLHFNRPTEPTSED
jgi:hypothetical protein